ncbi:MAG: hypothetical protein DHS20C18_33750 [Saprospiraceae bacterium]|nr:MAG: hypothetical protein DHS20C18_33750 [Saprospiraceae bacterium]
MCICFPNFGFTQSAAFIELLPGQVTSLSSGEQQFVQNIEAMAMTSATRIVELGDLKQQQQGGYMQLTIPDFETSTFIIEAERVDWQGANNYTWSGKVLNEPGGYAIFMATPDGKGGVIQLEENFYALLPLGGDNAVLVKQNYEAVYTAECGTSDFLQSPPPLENDCEDEYNECAAIIDVLVLVTNDAMNFFQGLGSNPFAAILYAGIGIESVNLAFQNSDVPNKRIRWELARFDFDFADPQNIDIDIANLIGDSEANQLRDEYRADIVIMLTDQGYINEDGLSIFGTVMIGEIPASVITAYAIVEVPFMLAPRWTFAHEFAHLLGARHNRSSNVGVPNRGDNTDICAHAWRIDNGDSDLDNDRRTILALSGAVTRPPGTGLFDPLPGERILNYSNPDIDFDGEPTGDVDSDNSRIIRNKGCEVSNFRASPLLGVQIDGNPLFCGLAQPPTAKIYKSVITPPATGMPGIPPYSYEWRWNSSGVFDASSPGTLLGTTQDITISSALNCPHFFLKVTVTSSDAVVTSHTRKIITALCSPPCLGQPISTSENNGNSVIEQADQTIEATSQLSIFPNPSSGKATVQLYMPAPGPVEITLIDLNGRTIKVLEFDEVEMGLHQLSLDLVTLPSGIYNCQVKRGEEVLLGKLAVTH